MPWLNKKDPEKLMADATKKTLTAIGIELNREVKKKLTYEYLGVRTGTLRNTTGAIIDGGKLYFGTRTNYGYGYETGKWKKAGGFGKNYLKKKGEYTKRKASWTGARDKRPFLKDTIEDEKVQAKIIARLKNAK